MKTTIIQGKGFMCIITVYRLTMRKPISVITSMECDCFRNNVTELRSILNQTHYYVTEPLQTQHFLCPITV